jgi:hypothetical protein
MKDVSRRPGVTTFLGTACRVGPVCQTGPLESSSIGNLYHGTQAYRKRDSWERTGPEWARFAEARSVRAGGADPHRCRGNIGVGPPITENL